MKNVNQDIRKAHAEGISVQSIKNILTRIHGEAGHGVFRDMVDDVFVTEYHGIPEYCGDYMYSGWMARRNDVMPTADLVETRWSKSPTVEPTTPKKVWAKAVQAAPAGAILEFTCSMEHVTEVTLTKVSDDVWERVIYCGRTAQQERDMGVTLYEGIREQVAKELGVGVSSTFHLCFDAAVDSLLIEQM